MLSLSWQVLLLIATTFYQLIACWQESRSPALGQFVDCGNYRLHYVTAGKGKPTIVLDHSLGGVEGYLLLDELAKLSQVCIYDRPGFGWSDPSPHPRTSDQIVTEFDMLLTGAKLEPPYILVGDSFGSYNMRLYAHRYPHKVVGLVLTDGLHEDAMLKMPFSVRLMQLFFASGFVMSILGSSLGIIRLLKVVGTFELIKPQLRQFSPQSLYAVKRSFCRPKHWLTMTEELLSIDASGRQMRQAQNLGNLPIVSIKANSFFEPSLWTKLIPLKQMNKLRDLIHSELLKLSSDCVQLHAEKSDHFVWVDQPDVMIQAVKLILEKVHTP